MGLTIPRYTFREIGYLEKALELSDYLVDVREDLAEAHTLRATILEDSASNC